jgi:hypothetical protein
MLGVRLYYGIELPFALLRVSLALPPGIFRPACD